MVLTLLLLFPVTGMSSDYTIDVGDTIEVKVFGRPSLGGVFKVKPTREHLLASSGQH